jgi:hypothetical protein
MSCGRRAASEQRNRSDVFAATREAHRLASFRGLAQPTKLANSTGNRGAVPERPPYAVSCGFRSNTRRMRGNVLAREGTESLPSSKAVGALLRAAKSVRRPKNFTYSLFVLRHQAVWRRERACIRCIHVSKFWKMRSIHPATNLRNFLSIHEISIRDKSKNQIQNCIAGKVSCGGFEAVRRGPRSDC